MVISVQSQTTLHFCLTALKGVVASQANLYSLHTALLVSAELWWCSNFAAQCRSRHRVREITLKVKGAGGNY